MKISIVSPVYGARNIIKPLVESLTSVLNGLEQAYEIILVEDGCPQNSWDVISEICETDKRVVGIRLSRNFGQHYAISAGLAEATGDVVIVMDCDLQDDPKYIPELISKYKEGFDVVYTLKAKRKHGFFKNMMATVFNSIFNWLVENKGERSSSNAVGAYSLLSRKVVDAYLTVGDYRRHYLMILRWLGFQSGYLQIEHNERFEGKSSYTFSKLIVHALDGIVTQSDKLLRLTIILGVLISVMSLLMGIWIIAMTFFTTFKSGWASTMVVSLFIGGLIIMTIGVSAMYIGKIYEQVKGRPMYIIDKKLNR